MDLTLQNYREHFYLVAKVHFVNYQNVVYTDPTLRRNKKFRGLQAFAFSGVTVNDEHTEPGFRRKRRG